MILQKCQKKYNLHLKKSKEMAYYMQNICSSQHSSVVELLICNQWVAGSNPAAGSIFLCVNCTNEGGEAGKEVRQKTVLCNFCAISGSLRHSIWFRIIDTKNPAAGSIFLSQIRLTWISSAKTCKKVQKSAFSEKFTAKLRNALCKIISLGNIRFFFAFFLHFSAFTTTVYWRHFFIVCLESRKVYIKTDEGKHEQPDSQ